MFSVRCQPIEAVQVASQLWYKARAARAIQQRWRSHQLRERALQQLHGARADRDAHFERLQV